MTLLYYLPDSRDSIDASYDFDAEKHSPDRETRDDSYCHEVIAGSCDGMLISYAAIQKGRHSAASRRRLLRSGARDFFRAPKSMRFMGDCGAFSYVKDDVPPYTVTEVAEFYGALRLDYGLTVDHIVPGFAETDIDPEPETKRRWDLTLELARDFLDAAKPYDFTPVAAVQGWSPNSYALAAEQLQAMGYSYLALGGLVKLKTSQIHTILAAIDAIRLPSTRIHLLGVTRPGNAALYVERGVASIDSTSPLRRAWMDSRHNYWIGPSSYMALRIPPSTSPKIRARVASGELDQDATRKLEEDALAGVASYAAGKAGMQGVLEALLAYGEVHSPGKCRRADYQRTLEDRPWTRCSCSVCTRLGHHVIVLRGAERNRARGFHNVGQFAAGLREELRAIGS